MVFYAQRLTIENEMTLAACEKLIARVWKAYHPGATPPRVTPGHMARRAMGSRMRIDLPKWSRQQVVVLHETAHSLAQGWEAWHGPEFVRLYVELLTRWHRPTKGQRGALLRSARARKILVGKLETTLLPAAARRRQRAAALACVEGDPRSQHSAAQAV